MSDERRTTLASHPSSEALAYALALRGQRVDTGRAERFVAPSGEPRLEGSGV